LKDKAEKYVWSTLYKEQSKPANKQKKRLATKIETIVWKLNCPR